MSDSDEDQIQDRRGKKNLKRKIEDDEDDEILTEHEIKQKKQRQNLAGLILDEAGVDDDDEDEDYSENEEDMMMINDDEEEVEQAERDVAMHHREMDNFREMLDGDIDEDALEEYYRQRGEQEEGADFGGQGGTMASGHSSSQHEMPTPRDPSLWLLSCARGQEKETVHKLMYKYMAKRRANMQPNICSVTSRDNMPGYILVEAYSSKAVSDFVEGLSSRIYSAGKITKIPIDDMINNLKVLKSFTKLEAGQWVRLTKGLYKGDLGKLVLVNEPQNKVTVQLIPRIDYKFLASRANGNPLPSRKSNARFRARTARAMFSLSKINEIGLDVTKSGEYYVFKYQFYDEDGFLIKDFKLDQITTRAVAPEIDEIEQFNLKLEDKSVGRQIKQAHEEASEAFYPSDRVVVTKGQLAKLVGKVKRVEGQKVTICTDDKTTVTVVASELRKIFVEGTKVVVRSGVHEGKTGMVVHHTFNSTTLLCDSVNDSITVAPRCLLKADTCVVGSSTGDFGGSANNPNRYETGDLIMVDKQTAGVIVQFRDAKITVLATNNRRVELPMTSQFEKKKNFRAVTLDVAGNQVRAGDQVKIISGPHEKKNGEVKHLFKGHVFVHNRMLVENDGYVVVQGKQISKKGTEATEILSNTVPYKSVPHSPRVHNSGATNGAEKRNNGFNRNGSSFKKPFERNEHRFIGSKVRVCRGNLKGSIGTIKEIKLNDALIELHSGLKSVRVLKENFKVVDDQNNVIKSHFGITAQERSLPDDKSSIREGLTPVSSRSPAYDPSKTPAWGSMTPAYHQTMDTPRYGGRTPMVGGTTPRFGDSSISRGAFDPVAATPAVSASPTTSSIFSNMHQDSSSSDLWGSSPMTPRTPAYAPQISKYAPQTPAYTPRSPGDSPPHIESPPQEDENGQWLQAQLVLPTADVLVVSKDQQRGVIMEVLAGDQVNVRLIGGQYDRHVLKVPVSDLRKTPIEDVGHKVLYCDVKTGKAKKADILSIDGKDVVLKSHNDIILVSIDNIVKVLE